MTLSLDEYTTGLTTSLDNSVRGQPRYRIQWAGDPHEPLPPMDWIVEGLFSAGSVSSLVGEAKSLKTYSMLHLAVCMSMGVPWLNHGTKQGTVLVVDEESKRGEVARRLNMVMRGLDVETGVPVAYISLARFNLLRDADAAELGNAMRETQARLVIVDALADVMLGGNEDAAQGVQPVFARLRTLADQYQAAIVVIHHLNKSGGARGSSAIPGAVDLMLYIERGKDQTLAFTSDQFRDGDSISFAARPHFDEGVFQLVPVSSPGARARLNDNQRSVLLYFRDHDDSLLTDVQNNTKGVSSASAKSAVYDLKDKGLVYRVNKGDRGSDAIYGLTSKGRDVASAL